ncbi:MAG: hypothetical protein U1E51_26895 [Candidatus Binatia bacterium]|nr:hypothetical protein [Candidatus Binatia bacterium]
MAKPTTTSKQAKGAKDKKPPAKTSYNATEFGGGNRFPRQPSTRWAGRNKKTGAIKAHVPNADTALQVATLASVGLSENEISVALDIRPGHLREFYGGVMESAPVETNFQVALQVREMARGGDNFAASAFWLTHRAKWTNKLELSGPGGGPMQAGVVLYLPKNGRETP